MMVHIIRDLAGQDEVHRLVVDAKAKALSLLKSDDDDTDDIISLLFVVSARTDNISERSMQPSLQLTKSWRMPHMLQISEIRLLNSESDDKLDYNDPDTPDNLILIGGDVLARGLTVEGLRTTVFCENHQLSH